MSKGKHLSDENSGWYHSSERGCTDQILYVEERESLPDGVLNWFGPFKTFGKCKEDAIGYHRCDVIDAQSAINQLRAMRKGLKSETK